MSKRFFILFTIGSVALLAGSWFHIIPFTITEYLGFITGALTVWLGARAWARSRVQFA